MTQVIAILSLVAACGQAPDQVAPADIERLAAAAAKALPEGRRIEGTVTRQVWSSTPGEPPPDISRDAPGMRQEYFARCLGPGHAVIAERPPRTVDVILQGHTYQVMLEEDASSVMEGARDPTAMDLSLLFQVQTFPVFDMQRPIADMLRESEPISLTKEGTVATYRFYDRVEKRRFVEAVDAQVAQGTTDPTKRPVPWPREITVDLSDPPRVLGLAVDLPWEGPDKPLVRNESKVLEWQNVGGTSLPRRVLRSTTMRGGAPYRQLVQLDSAAPLPDPAPVAEGMAAPSRPLPEGITFVDQRRSFTFTVGSPLVMKDGKPLRLAEPLWLHPGDRLDELLVSAKPE